MGDPTLTDRTPVGSTPPVDAPGPGEGWREALAAFVGIGDDLHLEPHEQPFADALAKKERQWARSAVYRGRPVWDEASAQYAVVVGRASERAYPFGVVASTAFLGVVAVFLLWATVALARDGDPLAFFTGAFAFFVGPSALWLPFASRTTRRARALNAHLLPDGFTIGTAPPVRRRGRWRRVVGRLVGGALVFGVIRVAMVWTGIAAGEESQEEALVAGAFMGVLFVGCGEAFRAFGRWRQSRRPGAR